MSDTRFLGPVSVPENRPFNPADISFAPECFEQIGTCVGWFVLRSSLHSGPARFLVKEHAEDFAQRTGRQAYAVERPVFRRIKWN